MMYTSAIFAALLTATQACSQGTNSSTKYLITFGDSYSQTGFDINGAAPSTSNPLGNPNLPGWTSSGGVNWVSSLISEFNTSLVLSYNFAYGGATVDSDLIAPYDPSVKSLIDQVGEFSDSIAAGDGKVWTEDDALFGVWMGVNDVGNTFWLDDVETVLGNSVDRYFEQLQILYDAGARQFVVLTVPPTDKTPLFLGNDDWSRERLQSAIALFNDLVAAGITTFQDTNEGTTVETVDTSVPFNAAISNPEEYGASDATCFNADGVSCLWFNDYHPATAIQRLVAEEVASVWPSFFSA